MEWISFERFFFWGGAKKIGSDTGLLFHDMEEESDIEALMIAYSLLLQMREEAFRAGDHWKATKLGKLIRDQERIIRQSFSF